MGSYTDGLIFWLLFGWWREWRNQNKPDQRPQRCHACYALGDDILITSVGHGFWVHADTGGTRSAMGMAPHRAAPRLYL